MYKIDIFVPAHYEKSTLDLEALEEKTAKSWHYASFGRSALFHILKPLSCKKVLIPVYVCKSLLEPLKRLGIEPLFYDLDIRDLNASIQSIKTIIKKEKIEALVIASMYGNPADLVALEALCKENKIFLIDDAAQSFGAKLDGQMIGTFGDAGFFSFSPGKPTAGHMGSFFWSKEKVSFNTKKHCLYHYIMYKDFYYNRLHRYDTNLLSLPYHYLRRVYGRFVDSYHDSICDFEKEILGGILRDLLNHKFIFRHHVMHKFIQRFDDNLYFRILKPLRGEASPHKIVLIFHEATDLVKMHSFLKKCGIFSMKGYTLLSDQLETLPNAKKVKDCILELPIEEDEEKMAFLFKKVEEFVRD